MRWSVSSGCVYFYFYVKLNIYKIYCIIYDMACSEKSRASRKLLVTDIVSRRRSRIYLADFLLIGKEEKQCYQTLYFY